MKTQSAAYRLRNWRDYTASLVGRGSLSLWIDADIAFWWLCPEPSGKPGASASASAAYSDRAIEACLSLRLLFRLPLRQVEGFVRSLFALCGVSLPVPDYTTLCRRARRLRVALPVRPWEVARHIVLDSTGLKVYGEGEWKVRKHGAGKRRVWRKLHLSVDEATGEVLAVETTDAATGDGPLLPTLVAQSQQAGGDISQASGDGAYDSWANDAYLSERGIVATIPPRSGSRIRQHGNCAAAAAPPQRDKNLRAIRKKGRKAWAKESGYTRRCLAETHMMRQKKILGACLASRRSESQAVECRLRCAVLNRLTHLGMPDIYPVYA